MSKVDISIALCTRNRARMLRRTLEHLRRVRIPPGIRWEIVIVNNRSTDDTQQVIAGATDLPIRLFYEAREGKSHAANTATEMARGDLILWTEDDVRPEPGWVEAYVHAASWYPDAAYFGGPVRPWFGEPPPRWLEEALPELASAYALLDLGPEARLFRAPAERPRGTNLALRRSSARRHRWSEERGADASRRWSGAEAAVLDAMQAEGLKGYWIPEAVVERHIPPSAMSLDFVRKRYRVHGAALMQERPGIFRAARSLLAAWLDAGPRYALLRALRAPPRRALKQFRRLHTHLGRLQGYRAARKS